MIEKEEKQRKQVRIQEPGQENQTEKQQLQPGQRYQDVPPPKYINQEQMNQINQENFNYQLQNSQNHPPQIKYRDNRPPQPELDPYGNMHVLQSRPLTSQEPRNYYGPYASTGPMPPHYPENPQEKIHRIESRKQQDFSQISQNNQQPLQNYNRPEFLNQIERSQYQQQQPHYMQRVQINNNPNIPPQHLQHQNIQTSSVQRPPQQIQQTPPRNQQENLENNINELNKTLKKSPKIIHQQPYPPQQYQYNLPQRYEHPNHYPPHDQRAHIISSNLPPQHKVNSTDQMQYQFTEKPGYLPEEYRLHQHYAHQGPKYIQDEQLIQHNPQREFPPQHHHETGSKLYAYDRQASYSRGNDGYIAYDDKPLYYPPVPGHIHHPQNPRVQQQFEQIKSDIKNRVPQGPRHENNLILTDKIENQQNQKYKVLDDYEKKYEIDNQKEIKSEQQKQKYAQEINEKQKNDEIHKKTLREEYITKNYREHEDMRLKRQDYHNQHYANRLDINNYERRSSLPPQNYRPLDYHPNMRPPQYDHYQNIHSIEKPRETRLLSPQARSAKYMHQDPRDMPSQQGQQQSRHPMFSSQIRYDQHGFNHEQPRHYHDVQRSFNPSQSFNHPIQQQLQQSHLYQYHPQQSLENISYVKNRGFEPMDYQNHRNGQIRPYAQEVIERQGIQSEYQDLIAQQYQKAPIYQPQRTVHDIHPVSVTQNIPSQNMYQQQISGQQQYLPEGQQQYNNYSNSNVKYVQSDIRNQKYTEYDQRPPQMGQIGADQQNYSMHNNDIQGPMKYF